MFVVEQAYSRPERFNGQVGVSRCVVFPRMHALLGPLARSHLARFNEFSPNANAWLHFLFCHLCFLIQVAVFSFFNRVTSVYGASGLKWFPSLPIARCASLSSFIRPSFLFSLLTPLSFLVIAWRPTITQSLFTEFGLRVTRFCRCLPTAFPSLGGWDPSSCSFEALHTRPLSWVDGSPGHSFFPRIPLINSLPSRVCGCGYNCGG